MRIAYIARHDAGGNRDEDAVSFALEELGHEVIRIHERRASDALLEKPKPDFVLFNKLDAPHVLQKLDCPKVFWYWDLVDWNDPTLRPRNKQRIAWMKRTLKFADLGFCTDGDWVERYNPDCGGKLVWLLQGFDRRVEAIFASDVVARYDISFFGISKGGGRERIAFVNKLRGRYGDRFHHCSSGFYGPRLAELIAQSRIVLGPSSPVTDRYWSNRVYWMCGLAGFLLHKDSAGLREQYEHGRDVVYYRSMTELFELIDHYLGDVEARQKIRFSAYMQTMMNHTYTHRCKCLVSTVKERLSI